jgi:FMN phosphatase YigB (HAD superfamily)
MLHLIFDYDGVLADTWEVGIQFLVDQGIVRTFTEGRNRRLMYFSNKPFHQTEEAKNNPTRLAEVEGIALKMNQYFVDQGYELFNRFIKELKTLKNVKMAVVSSGAKVSILPNIQKMNIPFSHILTIEDGHSKEVKIRRISTDWQVQIKDVLYFTDTLSDVYELETFMPKSNIIGCAWGYLGYDILSEKLPKEQILKNPKDIHRVLLDM